MRKMESLKFGIIGCSRIAKRSVIPAIMKSEYAELEIIGSRSTDKSKEFAKEFNCKKFGTYEDVISDDSVDAVYISTPIGTHAEWSKKATEAGKHVYVEKSSTHDWNHAQEMVQSAKENNVRLMEGFMFRFHPQHLKIKELIHQGKIGKPISFNGMFGFPEFSHNDIRYNHQLGGGFLNDAGCYPICASRIIFDEEPIGVLCNLSIDQKTNVDVNGTSSILYKNDKHATITYGHGQYYQAKYDVWGSQGIVSLERAFSVPSDFKTKVSLQYNVENTWNGRKVETFEIKPVDHFLNMIDSFCMEIGRENESEFNFEIDLLNQAKVMEAHRISSNEKRFVELNEIL